MCVWGEFRFWPALGGGAAKIQAHLGTGWKATGKGGKNGGPVLGRRGIEAHEHTCPLPLGHSCQSLMQKQSHRLAAFESYKDEPRDEKSPFI